MSGISSGIGLFSGIPTADLIDQLIQIERRPIVLLETRVSAIDVQRAAFLELSAQLLAIQNSVLNFGRPSLFRAFSAVSSNESVLTAQAGEDAAPGTLTFRTHSLVTNHSLISRGFADADTTPIGAGTISIEIGAGKVNRSTDLDTLNGGNGVRRGTISIVDRAGGSARIDLSTAITIDDVLDAINTNNAINVRASVTGLTTNGATGDRIVLTDLNDPSTLDGSERLIVADVDGGGTAEDLGIAAAVVASRIDGRDLVRLSTSTSLTTLNDGNGIGRILQGEEGTDLRFSTSLGDFDVSLLGILATHPETDLRALNSGNGVRLGVVRITDRSGQSADIDLTGARTAQDIIDAVSAANVSVSLTIVNSAFQISDTTGVAADDEDAPPLTVEDLSGFTAADLGIAGTLTGTSFLGKSVYRIETIGDVLNAINFAEGNLAGSLVEASISDDGNGLTLRTFGFDNQVTVTSADGTSAAKDLGLDGATFSQQAPFQTRRLVAGLDTVLLHSLDGGRGLSGGTVRFTDRTGSSTTVDFSGAQTLADVIDRINAETGLTASIDASGTGITLRDRSGGSLPLVIADVDGSLAADLGIAVTAADANPLEPDVVRGRNLQLQYITDHTLLSELNDGQGVPPGTFQITDSSGAVVTVIIDDFTTTVGQLIDRINNVGEGRFDARINDTGDGVVVTDLAGGEGSLHIEDQDGGRTADSLRITGTSKAGEGFIDGSFEVRIDVGAGDTLQDLVGKINDAEVGLSASVVNHGGSTNPFSLTVTSDVSGRRGELAIGVRGLDLGLSTLVRAQDAVITIGGADAANPILVTSSTNTIDGVVAGLTLDLLSTSDEPVTVTVAQDVDSIVSTITGFVDNFNNLIDAMDRQTNFDTETFERGPLLGDRTVDLVRGRLRRVIVNPVQGADPAFSRLFSIGLRLGAGGRLQFDEQQFREAYEASPGSVEQLFAAEETGFGAVIRETLEELTRSFDGVLALKDDLFSDQQEILTRRIDSLEVLLKGKRARLEAQFVGLEIALAGLQDQQNALIALAQLA